MPRRGFPLLTLLGMLAGLAVGGPSWVAAASPPNIVLILLDDVGYSDYGCFGSEIETPHIDRLARDGMRFTRFYNNAICLPTRAALLSGLAPRYVGPNARIRLTSEMVTIGELLSAAGYQTSLSGKWHLGDVAPDRPNDRGFAEFFGMLDGCSNHFDPSIPDPPFEGGRTRVWARQTERITRFPPDFYSSDAIADHAIRCIRQFAANHQPFFTHVCFTAAHSPLHAKPTDIAKYQGRYRQGWEALRQQRLARQRSLGIVPPQWSVTPREPEVAAWDQTPHPAWQENLMAVYAAMVDSIDQNIGRILQAVREAGVEQQTLVMVLNDNGGCAEQAGGEDPTNIAGSKDYYVSCGAGWAYAQNTPFRRYKGWVHEGGIATPLVACWPGIIPAGSVTHQVGHVMDLWPTLAEVAGAAIPTERSGRPVPPTEGISLTPVLRGQESALARGPLFWKAFDNYAVLEGRWKLVRDMRIGPWELYDTEADRTETRDLSGQHPELVARLSAAYREWSERTGAARVKPTDYTLDRTPAPLRPLRIALVGDSTMASYPRPPADRPTLTGWGQVLGEFFEPAVTVLNHAVSGRSSKSFLREGRWERVLAEKPDYVFIQFGHNDQPGKGDRTTDPATEFPANLRKYVEEARAAQVQPVLVTPVARRTFAPDGQAQTTLTPYAAAVRTVATELRVPWVDLHELSYRVFAERGDAATAHWSPSAADRSHFSRHGALEVARLVAYRLPTAVPGLREYLKQPWQAPRE